MTEIQQLQAQIACKNQQLAPTNQAFFGAITLYTRYRAFFKDKLEVERSLLEIQADLLDAQADGIAAADYFGPEPARTSRDLLRAMPTNRRAVARTCGLAAIGYVTAMGLPALISPNNSIDLGQLLLIGGVFAGFGAVFSLLLSGLAFAGSRPSMLVLGGLAGASVAAGVSGLFWLCTHVHTAWHVSSGGPAGSVAILALMACTIGLYRLDRGHLPRRLAGTFLAFYLAYGALGLAMRVPTAAHWLNHGDRLMWAVLAPFGLLYLGVFVFFVIPALHNLIKAAHSQ